MSNLSAASSTLFHYLFLGVRALVCRKVGEAIEEALQRMGCPYPLQAHQIQGLDYPAVLLVVQWLVKRVLATREESGDQVCKV